MTNKEAIEILKPLTEVKINENGIGTFPVVSTPLQAEALEIAIKALEERPQGEWIDYDNTFYKCPDCGYLLEKCCPQCQNKVILPKGGAE